MLSMPLFHLILPTDVQMIHGDFLKLRTKDWRDADVVFMNSTCFDESLMGKVAVIAGTYSLYAPNQRLCIVCVGLSLLSDCLTV